MCVKLNEQLFIIGVVFSFLFGVSIGSFLNVCIYRLPNDMSVNHPPSHCPNCNHRLGAWDLFPLFSFLFLGRKCRYCKVPISWRYFSIELLTGVIFIFVFLKFGYSTDTIFYALFASCLIVAFFADLDTYIIPDQVNIAGVLFGIGKDLTNIWTQSQYAVGGTNILTRIHIPYTEISFSMLPSILGIVVCGGAFYLVTLVGYYMFMPKDSKERENYEGAMGGGDVKLAAAVGAVLGMAPALVSFLIAVFLGAIIGIVVIMIRKKKNDPKNEGTMIPFGPYMVVGAFLVMFFYPYFQYLWQAWLALCMPS